MRTIKVKNGDTFELVHNKQVLDTLKFEVQSTPTHAQSAPTTPVPVTTQTTNTAPSSVVGVVKAERNELVPTMLAFQTEWRGPTGKTFNPQFVWDSGSVEVYMTKDLADMLELPNLGPISVMGASSQLIDAYKTKVGVLIGETWYTVDSVVQNSPGGSLLFGSRWLGENNFAVTLDYKNNLITITKP